MPTVYKRKPSAKSRGVWTAQDLQNALAAVQSHEMGVNEAAIHYNIPKSTFKRRIKTGNAAKSSRLGPDSTLGEAAERKLANHIKKLQTSGFAPTRDEVRIMAYKLAEAMNIQHKFNKQQGKAFIDKCI